MDGLATNGGPKGLAASSGISWVQDVGACSPIHTNHCYTMAGNLPAYSVLTGRGGPRVVGEVGNGSSKCDWVGNSITDARHIRACTLKMCPLSRSRSKMH